ncbi:hypothetical protein Fcan01_03913 [Folsomia candida]|uniref:Uncharacterized protein n=2 Tax=Folsomia candida TaxID=158441 RepID=A0A226F022_FOLCA|nr:hypothetical protein Fcan01_03913 [Folsomia candida]
MGTKRSEFSLPASQKFTSGPETPVHSQSPLRHFPLQPVLPPISLRNIYIFPETSHDKFKGPRLEMDIAFLDSLLGSLGNGAGSGAEPESSASLFERLGAAEVEVMLTEEEGLTVAQQLEKYGLEDMLDPNVQAIVSEAEMMAEMMPMPAPVPDRVTESVPTPAQPFSTHEVKKKSRSQKKKREEVPVSDDDEVQVVDVKPAKKMGLPKKVVIPGEFVVKRPRKSSPNTNENFENEGEGPFSSVKVWRGRGPNIMAEMLPAPVPAPVTESVPTPAPEPLSVPEVKKKSRPQKKKREEVPVSDDDEVQVVDVIPAKKMGLPKKVVIPGEFVKRPRKSSQNTNENFENEGEGPSSSVKVWRGRGPNRSKPPPQVKSRIQLAREEMMGFDAENEVIEPDVLIPEVLIPRGQVASEDVEALMKIFFPPKGSEKFRRSGKWYA